MSSLSHNPTDVRPLGDRSSQDWGQELRIAIRDPHVLCQELGLSAEIAEQATTVKSNFPLLVPRPFLRRMEHGNPKDPLLLQVLPLSKENQKSEGYTADPVGDLAATRLPGLLHKYHGRALLIASPSCAIHCRYCFRREFPYQDSPPGIQNWQPAIDEIADDETLSEVILSGGDPLMLVDYLLEKLIDSIQSIPHVKRLRIHTRLPVVIPQRITKRLVRLLSDSRLKVIMVIHANHGNELDDFVAEKTAELVSNNIMLLNQAVLLKEVNNTLDAQIRLSEKLVAIGVLPYYLHQLDRVQGAKHFDTEQRTNLKLIAKMREQLPGYMVPRYVVEEAGKPHKTLLA